MRFVSRVFAASALLCAAMTATTLAAVIYVNAAATGANNGSSWANAYTSLQTALGAANASDELWVVAGTYKPHASDRTVSFDLKNGVGVYGGFVGTETVRSQRNPDVNITTLSGDIGTAGTATDNSFHVVTAGAAVTNSGRLDGFTVSGGQADGNPASSQDRGAGLFNNGGAPLIAEVLFTGNFASFRGAGARSESGNPRFLSSTFLGNSVPFGAGGAGLSTGAGAVSIESCTFRFNSISGATTGGGGIQTAGNTTILNTMVAQNSPNGVQIQGGGNTIQDATLTEQQRLRPGVSRQPRQHGLQLDPLEQPRARDLPRRQLERDGHLQRRPGRHHRNRQHRRRPQLPFSSREIFASGRSPPPSMPATTRRSRAASPSTSPAFPASSTIPRWSIRARGTFPRASSTWARTRGSRSPSPIRRTSSCARATRPSSRSRPPASPR